MAAEVDVMGARRWSQMKPSTFEREWERVRGGGSQSVAVAVEAAVAREAARHGFVETERAGDVRRDARGRFVKGGG